MRARGLFVAFLVSAVWSAAAAELQSIEVIPSDKESYGSQTILSAAPSGDVVVELELGDTIENQTLRLHSAAGAKTDFVVEQRFETSLTVMQEGPHLDLLDWKHFVSPWEPLNKVSPTDFRTRTLSEADREKFPEVTPREIRAIVTREGGATLGRLVAKVKGPNDYPCGVGVSRISFRIKVKADGGEKVVKTIHFLVPMGC